jgi:formamidopyrimidine-DNA glycosylase
MPELPEVETMRRGILAIVGGRVAEVEYPRCCCKPISIRPDRVRLRRQVRGRTVQCVERRGKRLLIGLDGDLWLVIEPRMTGLVLVADPPNRTHLRVAWRLNGVAPRSLWFWDRRGLGTVELLTGAEVEQRLGATRLGPDALAVEAGHLRDRLRTSRRAIKVALLDQRAIAGIGNLYASEILHVAGIDPRSRCDRLSRDQWEQLSDAIRHVLAEAVQYEGSTLSDGTYRNALNRAGSYQHHHRVYDRAGDRCSRCGGGTIQRLVQAQRSTFWCPGCQVRRPKTGRRA